MSAHNRSVRSSNATKSFLRFDLRKGCDEKFVFVFLVNGYGIHVLTLLCISVLPLGVAPVVQGRVGTALNALIPKDGMSEDQLKIEEIREKWNSIRHLDRDVAQKELDGEWLEAYNRFYEKYDDDMTRMSEIAEKLEKMIEPPKVDKKTKGQKRRDAFARKMERAGTA